MKHTLLVLTASTLLILGCKKEELNSSNAVKTENIPELVANKHFGCFIGTKTTSTYYMRSFGMEIVEETSHTETVTDVECKVIGNVADEIRFSCEEINFNFATYLADATTKVYPFDGDYFAIDEVLGSLSDYGVRFRISYSPDAKILYLSTEFKYNDSSNSSSQVEHKTENFILTRQ